MKKEPNHRPPVNRVAACVSILLVTILVAGCVSINRLREAQDAFNQAAAAENAARLEGNPADAAINLISGSSGYASALLSLSKLDSKDQQSLQNDGLWGTALTLKALCQWRLGQYSQAMDTAQQAQTVATNQIYPRDYALLAALPGLIKTDQGYAKIFQKAPFTEVEALLVGPSGAVQDIEKARHSVGTNHPVQLYLIQAQLAAYRNYTVAVDQLNGPGGVPATNPARSNAVQQLVELDRLLKMQKDVPNARQLVVKWGFLCGQLPVPPVIP